MTYEELKDQVAFRLNREGDSRISQAISQFATDRIRYFQTKLYWPSEEITTSAVTLVAGQASYALTDDPLQIQKILLVRILLGSSWIPMTRADSFEELLTWDATSPSIQSVPAYWALLGNNFRVYPAPNQVYSIQLTVQSRFAEPASDATENFWTTDAATLIIESVCADICLLFLNDEPRALRHAAAAKREKQMLDNQSMTLLGPLTVRPY